MSHPAISTAAPTGTAAITPLAAGAADGDTSVAGAFTALLAAALGDASAATAAALPVAGDTDGATEAAEAEAPAIAGASTDDEAVDPGAIVAAAAAAAPEPEPAVTSTTLTAAGGSVDAGGDDVAPSASAAEPPVEALAGDLPPAAQPGTPARTPAPTVAPAAATQTAAVAADVPTGTAPTIEPPTAVATAAPDPAAAIADDTVAPTAPTTTTIAPPATPDAGPEPGSAVARMVSRVLDALDVLENAPPPRRMTVELPDVDGLRLHVALRGSEVTVTVLSGGNGDAAGWSRDLGSALASRGFSLGGSAGEAGDRRQQPAPQEHPDDAAPATVGRRPRPTTTDQGLRL